VHRARDELFARSALADDEHRHVARRHAVDDAKERAHRLAAAGDRVVTKARLLAARLRELGPDLAFATEAERAAVPDFDTAWVIKLGPRGASFPEGVYPAPPVDAVDTTGAGDALAAGYLVGGPELAIEAAARCVGVIGAMPSPDV